MPRSVSQRRYQRAIQQAKLKARSELGTDLWTCCDYANTFNLDWSQVPDDCPRINSLETTFEQFRTEFELPNKPVVIQNDQLQWDANHKWSVSRLAKKFRNQRFKCGEDDHGNSVKLKMKYYVQYMLENKDDSPLYIFDANFGEHQKKRRLLEDFTISKFFPEDLFSYGSNKRRPPYRWFVMGPARSGTGIHIDPLGTSAWNALVKGYKRWCLYPPKTPKELLKPRPEDGGKNKNEAIAWFHYVYPRTRKPDWPSEYKPVEFVQHPGETVFVPCGWWHVVLNLTDTVAVTQNFCSSANFPIVWHKTSRARPRFTRTWVAGLQANRPDLIEVANKIDTSKPLEDVPSSSASSSSSSSSDSGSDCSCSDCGGTPAKRSRATKRINGEASSGHRLPKSSASPSPKRMR